MLHPKVRKVLDTIKEEINAEYGFQDGVPRINYGPCGVFAHIFFKKWNELFDKKAHICFIMNPSRDECDYLCICLPSGELYDGGIGIHRRTEYSPKFIIDDMYIYDETLLEKWPYGLERTYSRFCSNFSRKIVENIVHSNLESLAKGNIQLIV